MEWETRVHDSPGIIPIIIDWADEAACNIVTNATFVLPMGTKVFSWIVTVVDPFRDCDFKPARVVTTCVVGT
jgi:hypothetical protein